MANMGLSNQVSPASSVPVEIGRASAVMPAVSSQDKWRCILNQLASVCELLKKHALSNVQDDTVSQPGRQFAPVLIAAEALYKKCEDIVSAPSPGAAASIEKLCNLSVARDLLKRAGEALRSVPETGGRNDMAKDVALRLDRLDRSFCELNETNLSSFMNCSIAAMLGGVGEVSKGLSAAADYCGSHLLCLLSKREENAYGDTVTALKDVVSNLGQLGSRLGGVEEVDQALKRTQDRANTLLQQFSEELSQLNQPAAGSSAEQLQQRLERIRKIGQSLQNMSEQFFESCRSAGISEERIAQTRQELEKCRGQPEERQKVMSRLFEEYSAKIAENSRLTPEARTQLQLALRESAESIGKLRSLVGNYLQTGEAEYAEWARIAEVQRHPDSASYAATREHLHHMACEAESRGQKLQEKIRCLLEAIEKNEITFKQGLERLAELNDELGGILSCALEACPRQRLLEDRRRFNHDCGRHASPAERRRLDTLAQATDDNYALLDSAAASSWQTLQGAVDKLRHNFNETKEFIFRKVSQSWMPVFSAVYEAEQADLLSASPSDNVADIKSRVKKCYEALRRHQLAGHREARKGATAFYVERLHKFVFLEEVFQKVFPPAFRGLAPYFQKLLPQEKEELARNLRELELRLGRPVFTAGPDGRMSVIDQLELLLSDNLSLKKETVG